jgi:glutathione S-transferase
VLELYQDEACPHSAEVRETLAELGVSYVLHNPRSVEGDVRNEASYRRLVEEGGQDQLPYLVDAEREETLYESDEIVAHLEEHYA